MDYREVAEVAAIALTKDRLNFGTYELCAEGHFNRFDVAALMSEVLGREIKADKLDLSHAPAPPKPLPAPQAEAMKTMMSWYDHHGLMGNALTLRAILGREPHTLAQYLGELPRS